MPFTCLVKNVDMHIKPIDLICVKSIWEGGRMNDTMNMENQLLVTIELVEFEKRPVEVQDFKKINDHFREIYGIYLKLINENPKDQQHVQYRHS